MNAQFSAIWLTWRRSLWLATALVTVAGSLALAYATKPLFATQQIRVDEHVLEVEIADTLAERARGLMWRTQMPEGTGMLFLFDRPQRLSFWMKDTPIDLDIGFFGEDGRLQQIETMRALDLTPLYSDLPARYALEVRRGWYADNDVRVGAQLYLPAPWGREKK